MYRLTSDHCAGSGERFAFRSAPTAGERRKTTRTAGGVRPTLSRLTAMTGILLGAMAAMASPTPSQQPDSPATYTVSSGDTLFSIARRHGLSVAELARRNAFEPDQPLKVGAILVLAETVPTPSTADDAAAAPTTPDSRPSTYQVEPGDNLFRIAQALAVSPDELAEINGLAGDSILQIGQVLRVPGVDAPAAAPVTRGTPLPSRSGTRLPVRPTAQPADLDIDEPAGAAGSDATRDQPALRDGMPEAVWVSDERIHLRAGASTTARSMGQVAPNTRLEVLDKTGMWWKVAAPGSGRPVYVAGWLVERQPPRQATPTPAAAPEPATQPARESLASGATRNDAPAIGYGFALEARIAVRDEPRANADIVAAAVRGTRMDILEEDGPYLKVRFDNGTVGWVVDGAVRRPPSTLGESADGTGFGGVGSATGQAIADAALAYRGVPYRRGGTSRGGVDCSGLVYAVCREFDIRLPRTSSAMYGHGTSVSRGDLQPGDLVFFKNTYRRGISHVGIYVGDGQFVHAVRPGRGVQVSALSESYYVNHYAGAFRVSN